jgi:hypothetical protein
MLRFPIVGSAAAVPTGKFTAREWTGEAEIARRSGGCRKRDAAAVELTGAGKSFGGTPVVDGVSLTKKDGK